MHIEIICKECGKSLGITELNEQDYTKYKGGCCQIEAPFCIDCANLYMYSGGTMNLEQPRALSLENKGEVLYKIAPRESIMG